MCKFEISPTRFSVEGCEYVIDFLKKVKKEYQLSCPHNTAMAFFQPDGKTEIKPTDTVKSLGNTGKDGDSPLIVKTLFVALGLLLAKASRKSEKVFYSIKYNDAF